jgi:hypothetical protein
VLGGGHVGRAHWVGDGCIGHVRGSLGVWIGCMAGVLSEHVQPARGRSVEHAM